MRALVVQHDHVSPPGPVGEAFAERGYDVEEFLVVPAERFAEPGVDARFPDPASFDVVVPMGAPWSVGATDIASWVGPELAMLRTAVAAGVPVLGICFGGQALAAALGGAVERAPATELGWVEIATQDAELVPPGPWFQWHQDRWRLPPGARELARRPVPPRTHPLPAGRLAGQRWRHLPRGARAGRRRTAGADPRRGACRRASCPRAGARLPRPGRRGPGGLEFPVPCSVRARTIGG